MQCEISVGLNALAFGFVILVKIRQVLLYHGSAKVSAGGRVKCASQSGALLLVKGEFAYSDVDSWMPSTPMVRLNTREVTYLRGDIRTSRKRFLH